MTNEQREAIDRFKHLLNLKYTPFNGGRNVLIDKEAIEIVLSLIKEQQEEMEKKDKIIEEIQEELRDHIGFENRLKRENKEPDLFNQGRFYVANNINNILKGKLKNVKDKR